MKYSTIYHISSKIVLVSIFFKVVFMYNDKLLVRKIEFIPPIPYSIIPFDLCQKISLILQLMAWHPSFNFSIETNACYISN